MKTNHQTTRVIITPPAGRKSKYNSAFMHCGFSNEIYLKIPSLFTFYKSDIESLLLICNCCYSILGKNTDLLL